MAETPSVPNMTPYLVRAVLDYCRDTGMTPYIVVAVDDACAVPQEYVQSGQIVFDVSDEAVNRFDVSNDWLTFQARFGEANTIFDVAVPVHRIIAVMPFEHQEFGLRFPAKPTPPGFGREEEEAPAEAPKPAPRRFTRVK